jgi:hypothetical protein
MKLRHATSSPLRKGGTRIRRGVAAAVAATAGGAGLVLATPTSAHADEVSSYSTLVPASDWLNIAVSGGSTSPGAPIIQWWADGGAEQEWLLPISYEEGPIINENSQMCITTDGVPGDTLTQEPCDGSANQNWMAWYGGDGPTMFENMTYGLVMDVYGYNMWAGGVIDGWYPSEGPFSGWPPPGNQAFWSSVEDPCPTGCQ